MDGGTAIVLEDVSKYYLKRAGILERNSDPIRAVDGVTLNVKKGSTFGLVGESGSGKTTIGKIVVGIIRPDSGNVNVKDDTDMVFQDPFGSLNPRMNIKEIIGESLYIRGFSRQEIYGRVSEVLRLVNLTDIDCAVKYPHQFSGGERQRIAIARALIRKPGILVLDEPVSSLDVSIQAGILNLLKDLQDELGFTCIFISHDLRVVRFMADMIGIMKDGKIVETASRDDIYDSPKHEYTRQLIDAIPDIGIS